MGAPIEGWENRRGNFNQRNGIGKGRQGRAFNSVPAPVKFGGLMLRPPRPPFPLNREGMRHPIPPPFGIRTPIRGCRPTMRGRMISQIAPPRLMGPRGPPPLGIRPPQQGFRPPLLGMRLPPQYMMGRPPMPPPPVREFRPGNNIVDNWKDYYDAEDDYYMNEEDPNCNSPTYNIEDNCDFGNSEQNTFSCDGCDRDFYSKSHYDQHMSEHRVCNLDGCTFTAHESIIEKHIRMQHSTGLYDKIRNISTPEDVAKWVDERKRKYPKKENIIKRYELQEEMIKRGVRIKKNENKFGKDKFRLAKDIPNKSVQVANTLKKRNQKKPMRPKVTKKSLIDEKSDWNGNMFPFRGTSQLIEQEKSESEYEDDEWNTTDIHCKPVVSMLKLNNALGALMGAYISDDEEEIEEPVPKVEIPPTVSTQSEVIIVSHPTESDEEPPIEKKIEKQENEELKEEVKMKIDDTVTRKRRLNTSSSRRKNSRFNKRRHTEQANTESAEFPYRFKKRKVTLLEKLLRNEIRHERNVLLQCVRHVVKNNFFDTN